jgi:predicted nucleic acid-binding protein
MPAGYLLDTNVISETRKSRPDSNVVAFLSATDAAESFLSVLTLGELRKGVEAKRRSDALVADRLGRWVDGIEWDYADRLLPIDAATARRWGELSAGKPLPVIDGLLAATALEHDLVVVTRNIRDFESTGAALLDPWQSRRR